MRSLMGQSGRRSRWVGALFVAGVLGLAASAQAAEAPKDVKVDAKAHFRAGQNHYNLNEFAEALREFKEAYRLYPDPVFLYNLGQCERQLGRPEEAIRFYRSYLREQPRAANRQDVLHRIEELEETLRSKAEAAPAAPPPAALPATAPATSIPGPAEPAAALPSLAAVPTVEPATPSADRIDLTAVPATAAEPTTGGAPIYKRWWFWTAAAVVAASAGVGIYAATAGGGNGGPATELGARRVF
jgi:tetratricopeptide (TPR) repeat protein